VRFFFSRCLTFESVALRALLALCSFVQSNFTAFSHASIRGFIPSDYFLIEIPATGNVVPQKPLFYDQNPMWICTRPDFDHENRVRLLAGRVQKVREKGASAIVELCDFNLLVFAASLGIVPIEEVKALTREITRPVVDEILVRLLLQSPAWETLVSSCL
jgi:hypothetical protein